MLATIAETGEGVGELVREILAHADTLRATGFLSQRRKENMAWELKAALSRQMLEGLENNDASVMLSDLVNSVIEAKTDFYDALNRLAKAMKIQMNIQE